MHAKADVRTNKNNMVAVGQRRHVQSGVRDKAGKRTTDDEGGTWRGTTRTSGSIVRAAASTHLKLLEMKAHVLETA